MSDQLEEFVPENLSMPKGQRYRPFPSKSSKDGGSPTVGVFPRVLAVVFTVAVSGLLATGMAPPGAERTTVQVLLLVALYGVVFTCSVAIYFTPFLVAKKRNHRNAGGILVLNLFFGWTLVGWVGALCWALYVDRDNPRR